MTGTPCTAPDCQNPTHTYLCTPHRDELHADLERIPALAPTVERIALRDDVPFTTRTANTTHGKPGPQTPIDLGALVLARELWDAHAYTADEWAADPHAADHAHRIHRLVDRASRMVEGEPEEKPTPDYVNYRLRQANIRPMPTPHLVAWFAEHLGIHLTPGRIRLWAFRGKIQRRDTGGKQPHYHPADILRAIHRA